VLTVSVNLFELAVSDTVGFPGILYKSIFSDGIDPKRKCRLASDILEPRLKPLVDDAAYGGYVNFFLSLVRVVPKTSPFDESTGLLKSARSYLTFVLQPLN
jgi:hypothetical protein